MMEHNDWRQSWVEPISAAAAQEPTPVGRERATRQDELTGAAAGLHEAIDALTRAFLGGSPVEKATARDRFEVALATYSALIETG